MSWHEIAFDTAFFVIKSPFRNLWPLVVAPAAAALISDRTARLLPRIPAASVPAAALAAVPGLVGLAVIFHAINIDPVNTWRGVVAHRLTPLLAAGLLAYAIVRAVQRHSQAARLFALARPASGRLASTASRLGLRALEIPSDAKDCFVAGAIWPTVFVSTGALAHLDEAEFDAALHHERAHVTGRDTLWLVLLAFLRDLAPWGRGVAFDAFRASREAAADRVAASTAGPLNLAAALIALARPGREAPGAAVLHMACGDTFRWRMQALLDGISPPGPSKSEWARLVGGIGFSAALLTWPLVQLRLIEFLCIVH
jgi:beta-lactamase regulating signal transducer with metallopeptidase domain